MPDVFDILTYEHNLARRLLNELMDTSPETGSHPRASQQAQSSRFHVLLTEMSQHEAAEESCLWPVVRQLTGDGDDLADQARQQELALDLLLGQIQALEEGDPEILHLLARLAAETSDHLTYEEKAVWPKLAGVLPLERARLLGAEFFETRQSMLRCRTLRPRTATP